MKVSLTSAAVSSWVSTRGLPRAFFPAALASSLLALVRERFLEVGWSSLSEEVMIARCQCAYLCNRTRTDIPG
jgi:hypothetical protein